MLILIIENPSLGNVSSLFEMKNFIVIKLFLIFQKNLNFVELIISSFLLNLSNTYFTKKYYINSNLLGIEIKDKSLRKISQFKINLNFLIGCFIINNIWFSLIFDKLNFFIFDECFEVFGFTQIKMKNYIYHSLFVLYSSKTLFKNLIKVHKSQCHFDLIKNPLRYLMAMFSLNFLISLYLTNSFKPFIFTFFILSIFSFIYNRIGYFIFSILFIYYIEELIIKLYLNSTFDAKEVIFIISNFKYSHISLLISILFILYVYSDNKVYTFYYNIYKRIFYLKVLFDCSLIVSYVYNLYEEVDQNYLDSFFKSYRVVFILFGIHYLSIFVALYAKLNFRVDGSTMYAMFGTDEQHIQNSNNFVVNEYKYNQKNLFGKNVKFFEIKLNKVGLIFIYILY